MRSPIARSSAVDRWLVTLLYTAIVAPAGAVAAVAPTSPPPTAAFGQPPQFSFVALSPNGSLIALDQATPTGTNIVMFRPGATEPRRAVSIGADTKLRNLRWANDQVLLIEVSVAHRITGVPSARSMWEFWQALAVGLDETPPRVLLLDNETRKWLTGARVLAPDPKETGSVAMVAWDFSLVEHTPAIGSRLTDERKDSGWVLTLFNVDTASGKGRVIERGTAYTVDWLVDLDGRSIARSEFKVATREFTVLASERGSWSPIFRQTEGGFLSLAGVTPDRKAVVAIGENGTDRSKAWTLTLDGSGVTVMFDDPASDVTAAIADPYTGVVVGFELGGLQPGQRWIDGTRATQSRALARAFPNRRIDVVDRSIDGTRVLVVVDAPSHPPVHYLVDFDAGKADIVGESYPGLAGAALGDVRSIMYEARDGAKIPAYLTLPPVVDEKDLPLVVLPHGGPEARDDFAFDWWSQFLATRGYAVLQPQFRGSAGFGRAHRLAGYGEWGGRMQDDVTDGVKHLIAEGIADPRRVCIVGASYGGYAALAGAAFTPDLYACAVSVNGISDLPKMLGDVKMRSGEQSDELDYWKDHIGSPTDPRIAQRSPARAARNITAPILLLHAADDTVVPRSQSEKMARALADARKAHALMILPGEDHWLSRSVSRIRMLTEIESFLAAHMTPAEP